MFLLTSEGLLLHQHGIVLMLKLKWTHQKHSKYDSGNIAIISLYTLIYYRLILLLSEDQRSYCPKAHFVAFYHKTYRAPQKRNTAHTCSKST